MELLLYKNNLILTFQSIVGLVSESIKNYVLIIYYIIFLMFMQDVTNYQQIILK